MTVPGTIITLTTDFGTRDSYVAAMKGVILGINPAARVVDLTHEIEPQNVLECALFLRGSTPYFPPGTVHVVVVDPGVGTERRALCVDAGEQYYIAPDNGVLSLVVPHDDLVDAVAIETSRYLRPTISATFHGRDVFAPAAAHLSLGVEMSKLGRAVHDMMRIELPMAKVAADGTIDAQVIHVDRFGNLITNVDRTAWHDLTYSTDEVDVRIDIGSTVLDRVSRTYNDVPAGAPLAVWGSSDFLEISVNQGNAAEKLAATVGDQVVIRIGTG
jgi:S-adenosylmethionine hydrolase